MTETLVTPSSTKMYGRLLRDLTYTYDDTTIRIARNNFLEHQLRPPQLSFLQETRVYNSPNITNLSSLADIYEGMEIEPLAVGVFSSPIGVVYIDSESALRQ